MTLLDERDEEIMRLKAENVMLRGMQNARTRPLFALFEKAIRYADDDCLFWPFGRQTVGYPLFTMNGRRQLVSRAVCEAVNGPPPTRRHEAAHSCGKGHLGCINGRHLRWATPKENRADRVLHGTVPRGETNHNAVLTEQGAKDIFVRANKGENHRIIARMYGIDPAAVSAIKRGRNWGWLTGDLG
jgi:hypothetical protein